MTAPRASAGGDAAGGAPAAGASAGGASASGVSGGGASSDPDLTAVHERLKALLAPYRGELHVAADGPGGMTLELPAHQGKPWGYVAGTRLGKRYVSYYLMGVYGDAALEAGISPELRRRMQGKSCFNFTRVDESLFAELAELTRRSAERQPELVEAALADRPRP